MELSNIISRIIQTAIVIPCILIFGAIALQGFIDLTRAVFGKETQKNNSDSKEESKKEE